MERMRARRSLGGGPEVGERSSKSRRAILQQIGSRGGGLLVLVQKVRAVYARWSWQASAGALGWLLFAIFRLNTGPGELERCARPR